MSTFDYNYYENKLVILFKVNFDIRESAQNF